MEIKQVDNYKFLRLDSTKLAEAHNLLQQGLADSLSIRREFGFTEKSLESIRQFKTVKALAIIGLPEAPIQSLGDFPRLESLTVDETKVELDFEKLPNLVYFAGDWHKGRFKNDKFAKLKKLHLWKYKSIANDLSDFSPFYELEELKLVQSTITSLKGISAFKHLTTLEMHYMNKLERLGDLDLPQLKFLHLDFCKKLTDHEQLQGCPNLETLRLHNCGAIKSVQFVKHLKKLKSFRFMEATEVVDGDLMGLDDVLFTQKKHYSHKTKNFNQHGRG
jgi:hypothetical protein